MTHQLFHDSCHFPYTDGCRHAFPPPPHPIQSDDTYRLWSMVSQKNQSFLKRNADPKAQLDLLFDGNVDDLAGFGKFPRVSSVNIEAKHVGPASQKLFRLQFADPDDNDKVYMITGEKQNGKPVVSLKNVDKTSNTPNEAKFEAIIFYAFTMFRCFSVGGETDLYLASDRNGNVLLMNGGVIRYPNPAMLFIANQVI